MKNPRFSDCLDRLKFKDAAEAARYWKSIRMFVWRSYGMFICDRCGWIHMAPREAVNFVKGKLKRERCVSDRDLHLQMARVFGISLEELQTKLHLSKIRLRGPGIEVVEINKLSGTTPNPWE